MSDVTEPVEQPRRAAPRWMQIVNLTIYLAAVATIAVVVNFFAGRPALRWQFDATKTRAYSLSDQTRNMLADLQGQWTVAMVVSEAGVSRSTRKQIDEVLRRYTDASPNIRVLRIDPDDPRSLSAYETLLRDLNDLYKDDIAAFDAALDAGSAAFKEFQVFAQQHAIEVVAAASAMPEADPSRRRLEQSAAAFQRIADQGQKVLDEVDNARRTTESQPIADFEGARSILAQALASYANETNAVADILRTWQQNPSLGAAEKAFAKRTVPLFEAESQRLAIVADPLKVLPMLDIGDIGRKLGEGEAAVILSPTRATVIPSRQVFPKSNLQQGDDGGVSFDQRFRGEQLLSAAIRSLTLDQMPRVVFVHAENDPPMLRPRDKSADVVGVAGALRSARYEVEEWSVTKSPNRPAGARGQRTVWIIVPPAPASSIEATPAVRALFDAADALISEGENVLLSIYPSVLAKYGQNDPFATLSAPFGIRPDTGVLILDRAPIAQGQTQVLSNQDVQAFGDDTSIGRALDGLLTRFPGPVPLKRIDRDSTSDSAQVRIIAAIEPTPERWLENDWISDVSTRDPKPEQRFTEPLPIVMSAERPSPMDGQSQRLIVVGSGGWMITNVTNQVISIGGGREALITPGNHELMLASVAWLAGLDDLIAASPLSQEVSRLRGITPQVRSVWWWIIVAGVPAGCVTLGVLVWLWRRR